MAMTWGPLPVRIWEWSSIGDVADVVQGFDVPVATDPPGEPGGAGVAGGQAGDGVDGDGPPCPADFLAPVSRHNN